MSIFESGKFAIIRNKAEGGAEVFEGIAEIEAITEDIPEDRDRTTWCKVRFEDGTFPRLVQPEDVLPFTKVKQLQRAPEAPEGYKYAGGSLAYWSSNKSAKKAYDGARWESNDKEQPCFVELVPDIPSLTHHQGRRCSWDEAEAIEKLGRSYRDHTGLIFKRK